MDILEEIDVFLSACQLTQDESNNLVFNGKAGCFESKYLADWFVNQINFGWKLWRQAQAVPEWKDYELEKPNDGQKCLVIFESKDCEDAQRWMCIDEFNEGMFDFIANWEDQCASVALPAGSIISKVRAVCWATTNLSNAPLSFDQFYEAQEPAND